LSLGIDIINDVNGLGDEKMLQLAVQSRALIVVMHNLGLPADRHKIIPEDEDAVLYIMNWMEQKLVHLDKWNIARNRVIFDPGIGCGKTARQSIIILQNIERLRSLGLPLLIGHSKKSVLDQLQNGDINLDEDRSVKTLKLSAYLASKNVEYLRVHDVAENKRW